MTLPRGLGIGDHRALNALHVFVQKLVKERLMSDEEKKMGVEEYTSYTPVPQQRMVQGGDYGGHLKDDIVAKADLFRTELTALAVKHQIPVAAFFGILDTPLTYELVYMPAPKGAYQLNCAVHLVESIALENTLRKVSYERDNGFAMEKRRQKKNEGDDVPTT